MPINAKEIYPEYTEDSFYGPGDYQPLINAIGKVAVQVEDQDYQGDTRVLYHLDDGQVGLLIIGWGSCSGCDALQATSSPTELQELCDDIERSVTWFPNPLLALEYLKSKDWSLDYSWHADEMKEFLTKAKEYLSNA